MWMKKTIPIVLLLCLAGSITSFADIVYENDYEGEAVGDGFPAWNWGDNGTVHNAVYAEYDGNIVIEHTGTIGNSTTAARNMRFGSKWDIELSGNTSSDPADYYIAFDIRSVSGNWDPIDLEFYVLTKIGGTADNGYGSGVSQYAQADGWVHVEANLADLTVGWWAGTSWDMTEPMWSIEVGGPPWPGTSIPAGTAEWDQIWLMDNLIITMGEEPPSPATEFATDPVPEDEATDVFREPSLSWTPGEFADTHNVYFGTDFDNVNDADTSSPLLVSPTQDANYYAPGRLEFGQTYFWRVDEVSAPPDNTVFKGKVWSFTVETFSYTMTEDQITATASSQGEGEGPENTIDRSGLDEDDKHSILPTTMWLTAEGQTGPIWIQYEFDKTYKLHEMLVWNYNGPNVLWWFGIKEVVVEYSTDGINWYQVPDVNEFASATGRTGYATNITIPFDGVAAKYVRITATSNWSNGVFDQYGLSEVRFLYIPTYAREPNPDDEATDVAIDTTLSWRPGREAAEHNIYISTNQQAVIDGTATAMTVNQASYSPDLALGRTYFWRVDEVNNAEVTPIWEGDLFWTFGTQEYLVVDDFESYNDIPQGEENSNLVYLTWIDGYDNPSTNGSTMGYTSGASLDTETVRSGHSAPLMYNNTSAGISKITANTNNLQSGSDWTVGSPERLVLWIYGSADNPSTEQMYVEVDGVKKIFSGDISAEQWQDFTIDLTSLGINLSNVRSMTIGFEKTGATGGSGIVFIDDIRLYGVAPAPKIVYVDATDGQAGNTMLATGEVFMADDPGTTGSGADGLWRKRAGLSNDGTIFESGGDWGGNNVEDCPRLMTSVEVPEGNYDVYVYMWTGDTAPWRIAASLENSVGDLPLYICADPNGGTTLAVADDFEEPVPLLTESNRTLWQAYLGATGTTTTITVYIDDDANRPGVSGNGNDRTWYDGIGYKAVLPEE